MNGSPPLTLLAFAPMIDSELARLVLAHYGTDYREADHVFGVASVLALRHVWTVQVPVLYGGGLRLAGPRAMVDALDRSCPAARQLVPANQPLRSRVEADWDRFNNKLAAETAPFAYFHLLPLRDLMIEPFCRGIPAAEAAALRSWGYPLMSGLLKLLLRLNAARADDALIRIRATLDHTDAVLADGRPYMTGDRLTLSDFALAAAIAPLLLPAGYGAKLPPLEQMPPPMAAAITECRARPTAAFVSRLYSQHPPRPSPG